jgi:hypothetical protein
MAVTLAKIDRRNVLVRGSMIEADVGADAPPRADRRSNRVERRRTMVLSRNLWLAWSAGLMVSCGLLGATVASAQEAEKVGAPAAEAKPAEAPKEEAKPAEEPKPAEEAKPAEEPKQDESAAESAPPVVPPEVEAKLEAARKAVAEAIVAAQDAGLVDTSINPPPVLDILVQGYANDAKLLKNKDGKKPYAVSPEVFAAWFTSHGTLEGVNYVNDVRILSPNAGLKAMFDQRAAIFNRHIEAVRKEKAAAAPAEQPKPEEAKPADAPKAEEAKPAEEAPKAEEAKPAEEAPKA